MLAEKIAFDKLGAFRYQNDREFFKIAYKNAIQLIEGAIIDYFHFSEPETYLISDKDFEDINRNSEVKPLTFEFEYNNLLSINNDLIETIEKLEIKINELKKENLAIKNSIRISKITAEEICKESIDMAHKSVQKYMKDNNVEDTIEEEFYKVSGYGYIKFSYKKTNKDIQISNRQEHHTENYPNLFEISDVKAHSYQKQNNVNIYDHKLVKNILNEYKSYLLNSLYAENLKQNLANYGIRFEYVVYGNFKNKTH